ncbi:MAG TPA: TonB-dependent receptor [Vicinamibacterales bacterium]|jgi:hypothetical protein
MFLSLVRPLALATAMAAIVGIAAGASAQTSTGRIDVAIEDSTGGRVPGVLVELTGPINQTATTDARGEAHFLNLTVGTYGMKATLAGFKDWQNRNIPVSAGVSVPLAIKLGLTGTTENVTVTGEVPVLDNKKQTTAVTVSLDELQKVPTARDPWVVMQSAPGIVMDRVNVGGSESGQQAGFMGKGSGSNDTTWNVDGMPITDMSSLSSPFYYDFDMFQEMSVVTGGSDPKSATGGIQMNMMLKSGTNAFHGGGRGLFENEGMQSTNLPSDLQYLAGRTGKGDRTEQLTDWGGDLGGPVLKDRWWFWAAYGKQDIRVLKLAGVHDRTLLKNTSLKTQGQMSRALRGSFTYYSANKQKFGRDASTTRTQETTFDQDGPSKFYKGELNYVVGSNLFLIGRFAYVDSPFTFTPEGGLNANAYRDDARVWHGSYYYYSTKRPQDSVVVDGNYFKGNHELKFGFTWRKTEVHSVSQWPGSRIISRWRTYPNIRAQVTADYVADGSSKYMNFYVGDTITLKRATINAGVRYDRQSASILPSVEPALAGFENLFPEIVAPGMDDVLKQSAIQPRIGVTYSLDEARKTQLRGTYAMFTSQLGSSAATFMSLAQYRYAVFNAVDTNGNRVADPGELDRSRIISYSGFDPANPKTLTAINQVGSYSAPKTHELIVGVDHELMPNFGVSASFTYRYSYDFNWRPLIGTTSKDFVLGGTLTGTLPTGFDGTTGGSYSAPYYVVSDAAVERNPAGGTEYQTRQGYHQRYMGFEVSATKRMSKRWMARFGFSTNDWREYFTDPSKSIIDPTHIAGSWNQTQAGTIGPLIDGGAVVSAAGGSGKSGIYMVQPKYQFIANGAYQAPYGIDLGASFLVRQGYPMPWYQEISTGDAFTDRKRVLLVSDFVQDRLPAMSTLDVRIGKTFRFGPVSMNADLDIFNLFNSATPLGRQYDRGATGATGYTAVMEILQPRIMRVGVRMTF